MLKVEFKRYNSVLRNNVSLVFFKLLLLLFLFPAGDLQSRAAPESFADLVEKLSPSVVNITSTTLEKKQPDFNPMVPRGSPFEDFFREFQDRNSPENGPRRRRGTALGSGFIISSDGFVVTNNHVIENADEIEIEMLDGTSLQATVYGRDEKTDIALLKVESDEPLPYVEFGDSTLARVGDWVLAIGNPLGQGFSVSAGIISARGRYLSGRYDDFIQTDAAINRGNSGGPLFDIKGKVIGVNTAILSPNGGSIGIGFSMSAAVVSNVVKQLKEFREIRRGWLGVRIQDITEDVAKALGLDTIKGALVTDVPEGPARKAGIKSGDIIVEFDQLLIENTRSLIKKVGDSPVGKKVNLKIIRDGVELIKSVELGLLKDEMASSGGRSNNKDKTLTVYGMTLSEITKEFKEKFDLADSFEGVLVAQVDQVSDAAIKGIQPGDIIIKVAQQEVLRPLDVQNEIDKIKKSGRSSVLLLIYRNGARRFVALALDNR